MQVDSLSSLPLWMIVALGVAVAVQITLNVIALIDLYRRPVAQVMLGNKWAWVAIILLVNFLGAILYFAVGRARTPQIVETAATRRETPRSVADSLYGTRDGAESE
ncbi:PLD nuclease N-terminal domain-containing protein [Salinibacterium sp. G-O1]|uniref:PLD nuclease N-terminal domain-containing protein n=1 Tax=Salinibacterium sp. G-O1 TaxID=3046208 RepID=UPI0024BB01BB|nr:PLD nuclease N-terminal domain-containing protein [Salinibacterium sp. G-O1]MDJ0335526.1 PLD nuclease N-terminal domain-containing protein [Salinibacterium sp. G-O1]